MVKPKTESPLTDDEKSAIWEAIRIKMAPDDRDPHVIINEDYGGDEERYLRVMAHYHNVPIGSPPKNKEA